MPGALCRKFAVCPRVCPAGCALRSPRPPKRSSTLVCCTSHKGRTTMKQFLIALKATLVLTLLTGVMYPLLVTGLAKVLFRDKADGSLIQSHGRTVGSELIGQRFTKPEYFHGRPSAAGNDGYDGLSSGGSNLGPTNQKLADRVTADVKTFRAENPTFTGAVPGDAVTASGSGLDPHLSPEAIDEIGRA